MRFSSIGKMFTRFLLALILFFPIVAFAGHLIEITETTPFPSTIYTTASYTATYTVTNLANKVPLTVIDQSSFPAGSGLSIASTTCGSLLQPHQSCQIVLQLNTGATAQSFSTYLKEWASPSADGVLFPININETQRFIVTPSVSGNTGGTISPNTPQNVLPGQSITFTATPAANFAINTWTVDGVVVQTGGQTYTLTDVQANHSVQVSFLQYTITPSAGASGTISPSTPQGVVPGGTITFTATPNTGFGVNQWIVDGSVAQTGGTTYTFTNVTANHTIEVTFIGYTLTPSASAGGSISPATVQTVPPGTNFTFTATPDANFAVYQWTIDGVVDPTATGSSSYTLNNIQTNHTIQVSFIQYTITPSVAGSGGTITPSTVQAVAPGANVTFTATPSTHYLVNQWTIDGVVDTSANGQLTYTISNVQANHTIQVSFVLQSFTITPSTGANGTITPNSVQTVSYGGGAVFTATPNANYGVNQWIVDGSLAQTGGTTYTFTNVTANHTISVSFAPTPYSVTPSATTGGSISPSSTQQVNSGGSLVFTATPDTGYAVYQWFLDGVSSQTGGLTYSLTNITANHSIQVSFKYVATFALAGNQSINQLPFLSVSTNSGTTWNVPTLTGLPGTVSEFIGNPSCTGIASSGVCIAQGSYNPNPSTPFAAISHDGGTTWTVPTIAALPATGSAQASACSGSGSSATCILAGINNSNAVFILNSQNGGTSFTSSTVSGFTDSAFILSASCTQETVPICIVAGQDFSTGNPLIFTSFDGGMNWTRATLTGAPATGELTSTTCVGAGSASTCLATGYDTTNSKPLLMASTNGAVTWNNVTPSSVVSSTTHPGYYAQASCISNTGLCITGGYSNNLAVAAISTNGGANWNAVTTPLVASGNVYGGATCSGSSSSNICVIAGGIPTSPGGPPLLYVTTNQGTTWASPTITNIPAAGYFSFAKCVGSGSNGICIAAGTDYTNNKPLLVESTDGGTTWAVVNITAINFNGYYLGGTGSTNFPSFKPRKFKTQEETLSTLIKAPNGS